MTLQEMEKHFKVHVGKVEIKKSLPIFDAKVGICDNFNVANKIWVEVREVLNNSNARLKTFVL